MIRAAGRISRVDQLLVLGSQSILGQYPDGLPPKATRSLEADLAVIDDPDGERSALIDAMIGLDSQFHREFGVYAHGVALETARLPKGWMDRVVRVPVVSADGQAYTGLCLEAHDLCASKLAAGRPHDVDFVSALLRHGFVDDRSVIERVERLEGLDQAQLARTMDLARQVGGRQRG